MKKNLTSISIAVLGFFPSLFAETQPSKEDNKVSLETAASQSTENTVIDCTLANEELSILVTALKAADLIDVLSEKTSFTIFAPTNKAFENLPEGTLEMLLEPENKDKLVELLTFHLVNKEVLSEGLTTCEVETLNGKRVTLAVTREKVSVEGAAFVTTDVLACNGVVHVIDTVLVPRPFLPQQPERLEASSGF